MRIGRSMERWLEQLEQPATRVARSQQRRNESWGPICSGEGSAEPRRYLGHLFETFFPCPRRTSRGGHHSRGAALFILGVIYLPGQLWLGKLYLCPTWTALPHADTAWTFDSIKASRRTSATRPSLGLNASKI